MLSSCIGDKTIYDEEDVPSFSELPFDHIILVSHTDVTSLKTEAAQRSDLVKAWLVLGDQGRLKYYHLREAVWSTATVQFPHVPAGVPEHLQMPQQRAQSCNEHLITIWVRTLYGNDEASWEKADKDYRKLCDHTEELANYGSQFIRGNWAFEDHEQLLSDPVDVATETGITPPYV
ncbi:hypothetical protein BKA61DRAFT_676332 [Leptodontidium sp. MPI-SDFR-AT-0119]|nr:hypothetical protein BKA61DRAFT_676332 [Leptodontidium sp. MPI-SDFR-AT-0119]